MNEIDKLLDVMKEIRAKCPWDASQTHQSLKRFILEESYETLEAIDDNDFEHLKKELGDLLLQIVFHSEIASEQNLFSFNDVVRSISEKMINRHPHVFKSNNKISAEEVQKNWEKNKHKNENRTSLLSGIPKQLPALLKARRLQEKAASVGFDWSETFDVLNKLEEEIAELKSAIKNQDSDNIKNEVGDLIFTIVNLSRFLKVDSEDALQQTNKKFTKRFNFIESHFNNDPERMTAASLKELDTLWNKAKEIE